MKTLLTILIVSAVGTLGVRHADIDINRVKLLPNLVPDHSSYKQIRRPSLEKNERLIIRSNDYDDHSSWYQHPRAPIPVVHDTRRPPVQRLLSKSTSRVKTHVSSISLMRILKKMVRKT
ncbi:hypothetical protein MSG28_010926 [Choristoneura fumiferana]|uniref:Uncharacterized protein n=1 Tax=Choristoneura fumiferana TaxID=7141 RepID=A0ACC0KQ35_CHOFU|nr:hypothetical protein MSG28_010926 [Choristoneura fumiferana]